VESTDISFSARNLTDFVGLSATTMFSFGPLEINK
jgi:hypothetical protein